MLERQHSTAATGATDFCLFVASNLDFVETWVGSDWWDLGWVGWVGQVGWVG